MEGGCGPIDASTFDLGAFGALLKEKTKMRQDPLRDVLGVAGDLGLQTRILQGSQGLPDYAARRNFTMMVMRGLESSENPGEADLDAIMKSARQRTEALLESIKSS